MGVVFFNGAGGPSSSVKGLLVTDLTTLIGTQDKQVVETVGYHAEGDGGGGVFYWEAGSVVAANGGTVFGSLASGRWFRRYFGGDINIKWFGAKGDGVTNDSPSFDLALSIIDTKGITIRIPFGVYNLSKAIEIAPVVGQTGQSCWSFVGEGSSTYVNDIFGGAQWPGSVYGSVLYFSNPANAGFKSTDVTLKVKPYFEKLALLGPGSGTQAAIDGASTGTFWAIGYRDLGIYNFYKGIHVATFYSSQNMCNLHIRGCNTGIHLSDSTNLSFFGTQIERCTIGILSSGEGVVAGGTLNTAFYGGLIQSCTTGISINDTTFGFLMSNFWFEQNTRSIDLSCTFGSARSLTFEACRESSGFTILEPAVNSVRGVTLIGCDMPGVVWPVGGKIVEVNNLLGTQTTLALSVSAGDANIANWTDPVVIFDGGNASGTYTPDWLQNRHIVLVLTGDITIQLPTNMPRGAEIEFVFRQTGIGGWTVAWAGGYITDWSDVGSAVNKIASIRFRKYAVWTIQTSRLGWT
jgi:hypothetical protein